MGKDRKEKKEEAEGELDVESYEMLRTNEAAAQLCRRCATVFYCFLVPGRCVGCVLRLAGPTAAAAAGTVYSDYSD